MGGNFPWGGQRLFPWGRGHAAYVNVCTVSWKAYKKEPISRKKKLKIWFDGLLILLLVNFFKVNTPPVQWYQHYFMALHQDYCSAKVWKLQTVPVFVLTTNINTTWCSKIGKNWSAIFWISLVVHSIYFWKICNKRKGKGLSEFHENSKICPYYLEITRG